MKGYHLIHALEYMNHASQKFARETDNNHFFSCVLRQMSSYEAIKQDHIELVWSVFICLPFFKTMIERVPAPENFADIYSCSIKYSRKKDSTLLASVIQLLSDSQSQAPCYLEVFFGAHNDICQA